MAFPATFQRRVAYRMIFVCMTFCLAGGAVGAQVLSGEATPSLHLVRGEPVALARAARPLLEVALPAGVRGGEVLASAGETAYFDVAGQIHAIDIATGHERWATPTVLSDHGSVAIGSTNMFVSSSNKLLVVSRANGHVTTLADVILGSVINDVVYAEHGYPGSDNTFVAYSATTLRRLWTSASDRGNIVEDSAFIRGSTLFQLFRGNGPGNQVTLYAFDARKGTALWDTPSNANPLGFKKTALYLNTTSFLGENMDRYLPLSVTTVDAETGRSLQSYDYAPDPGRDPGYRNTGVRPAQIAGNFVYIYVNQSWYRYDADTAPAHAHPVRLDGIDDISGWLSGTALLLTTPQGVVIGTPRSDRIETHALAAGALRFPITGRPYGTRYAVVGETLLAFNSAGQVRAIGLVRCGEIGGILQWPSRVAVYCRGSTAGRNRLLIYGDHLAE